MPTEKDPGNVARGLKAAINNPRVSEQAKEHDRERLRDMGESVPGEENTSTVPKGQRSSGSGGKDLEDEDVEYEEEEESSGGADRTRVMAGYKATLKNPNVSQRAKDHAAEILEQNDL
ncbi:hypothetical protein CC1G_11444 [Coprinopsis cinerea okayama7|uniref:Conidiation-specific protein 6 n=1 Tax=Coprinopsis cinerea (strain Okayama-7 / 130 / ATCC MYA-4618 / FGSC 9003) TaxID=240176 RepID=A8P015_COPC7|nr:hypothetical protein CC1G_11444 [Coprinopsis cinerea okayama7\|eukprot:XP_001837799.1 hypothetical protein CC1G_11444 [Coprinopsis cinerea okayama7\